MSQINNWVEELNAKYKAKIGRPVVAKNYTEGLDRIESIEHPKETKIYSLYNANPALDWTHVSGLALSAEELKNVVEVPEHLAMVIDGLPDSKAMNSLNHFPNDKYLCFDFLADFISGNTTIESVHQQRKVLQDIAQEGVFKKCLCIDLRGFVNHDSEFQLLIAKVLVNEYLNFFPEQLNQVYFKVALGTEVMEEIAKLRCLRLLYKNNTNGFYPYIIAESKPLRRKDKNNYNTLINRGMEVFAANGGKADALLLHPFDSQENPYAVELAVKQQLLWKEESGSGNFTDPIAGSYLIENRVFELLMGTKSCFDRFIKSNGHDSLHQWSIDSIEKALNKR